jgi:hypothetical protein
MRAWLETIGLLLLSVVTVLWVQSLADFINLGVVLLCAVTGKRVAIKHRRWNNFDDFLACQRTWDNWTKWLMLLIGTAAVLIGLAGLAVKWWLSSFDRAPL